MKNTFITISLLAFTLLVACKKSTTTTTSPNTTASTNATITPITSAPFYNGRFSYIQIQTVVSKNPLSYSYNATADATFRMGDSVHYKNIAVTSVSIDSVTTNFQSDTSYSKANVLGASCSWKIVGAGIIPSFSYTSTKLPNVTSVLPDTIDHTKPLSLFVQLNGGHLLDAFVGGASLFSLTGTDSATFNFTAGSFSSVPVGANTIQIESDAVDLISVNGYPMAFYVKRIFVRPVYFK